MRFTCEYCSRNSSLHVHSKNYFFKFVIIKLEFEAAMVLNVRVSRVQSMPHQFLDNGGFRS